jgi:sugar O-acyltransferase (sialic acid O-acetyltransferase NeuD family)
MLIIGAGGLAAQIFDELLALKAQNIVFWSEVDTKYKFIKEKFSIIKSDEEVTDYFNNVSRSFVLCIGGSENRRKLSDRFISLGGKKTSFLSPFSTISPYTTVGIGSVILSRVEIEAGVSIGQCCLINKTANVGHGCIIGDFCEIGPGVIITGEVEMGDNSFVGTGAIILPNVKIGKNAVISAASIVKKNVPENAVVSGDKATIKYFKK